MQRKSIVHLDGAAAIEHIAAALSSRNPLGSVAAPVLAELVRLGTLVELAAGEALVREGEASSGEFYVLLEGALAVQSQSGFIARLDRPGEVVGEVAVLLASKRTADVIAESPVRVLAIPSQALALPQFADVAAGVRQAMLRDDWLQY